MGHACVARRGCTVGSCRRLPNDSLQQIGRSRPLSQSFGLTAPPTQGSLTQKYRLSAKPCLPPRGLCPAQRIEMNMTAGGSHTTTMWHAVRRDGGSVPGSIGHSPSHGLWPVTAPSRRGPRDGANRKSLPPLIRPFGPPSPPGEGFFAPRRGILLSPIYT